MKMRNHRSARDMRRDRLAQEPWSYDDPDKPNPAGVFILTSLACAAVYAVMILFVMWLLS